MLTAVCGAQSRATKEALWDPVPMLASPTHLPSSCQLPACAQASYISTPALANSCALILSMNIHAQQSYALSLKHISSPWKQWQCALLPCYIGKAISSTATQQATATEILGCCCCKQWCKHDTNCQWDGISWLPVTAHITLSVVPGCMCRRLVGGRHQGICHQECGSL